MNVSQPFCPPRTTPPQHRHALVYVGGARMRKALRKAAAGFTSNTPEMTNRKKRSREIAPRLPAFVHIMFPCTYLC